MAKQRSTFTSLKEALTMKSLNPSVGEVEDFSNSGIMRDDYVTDRFSVTFAADVDNDASPLVRVVLEPSDSRARKFIDDVTLMQRSGSLFTSVRLFTDGIKVVDALSGVFGVDAVLFGRGRGIDFDDWTEGRLSLSPELSARIVRNIASLYRRLKAFDIKVSPCRLFVATDGRVSVDAMRSVIVTDAETDMSPLKKAAGMAGICCGDILSMAEHVDETMFGGGVCRQRINCHDDRERYEILCHDAPENRFPVRDKMTGRVGYCDEDGFIVIEPLYEEFGLFDEGLAVVSRAGKSGVIDRYGDVRVCFDYDELDYDSSSMTIVASVDNCYILLSRNGRRLSKPYLKIGAFKLGRAVVCALDGRYGYIDNSGEEVIPASFDAAYPFDDNLAVVERNGQRFRIDVDGNLF